MKPVKGVVFDIDGTLYSQKKMRAVISSMLLLNAIGSPKKYTRTIKVILNYRKAHEILRNRREKCSDLAEKQISLTSELSGIDTKTVCEIVDKWFGTIPLKILPKCKRPFLNETFDWLRSKNIRIGLFSDYACPAKARALGIDSYIGGCVSSMDEDVGCLKPQVEGYNKIARILKLAPGDIMYIGDREEVDITGAKAAGMQAVLMGRSSQGNRDYEICSNLNELQKLIESVLN